MKSDDPDYAVFRACITWDVDDLRRSDRGDVRDFLDAIQLMPSAFDAVTDEDLRRRMPPLRRAVLGLRAEYSGDSALAREQYGRVARRPGLGGLLGLLLLAWMEEATESDFDRVTRRLSSLDGRGSRDLAARVHCKLVGWAIDHGWRERAIAHFDEARRLAGADLRRALMPIGNWFEREQIFILRGRRKQVTFSSIDGRLHRAASNALERRLEEAARSPWTRTWTFGANWGAEGIDIQSAELQASWAGAIWMMPTIQRQHAALILENSQEAVDVSRAIGLWVRGLGKSPRRLIDAHEGRLTAETVDSLVNVQLNRGGSVLRRQLWLECCQALWDQLPDSLVDELFANFQGPGSEIDLFSDEAKEVELIGYLLLRRPAETETIFNRLTDDQVVPLASLAPEGALRTLTEEGRERLMSCLVQRDPDENWMHTGWRNVATLWVDMNDSQRARWRRSILQILPEDALPEVAQIAQGLVPSAAITRAIETSVSHLERDVVASRRGMFSSGPTSPSTQLARSMLALGRGVPSAISALVEIAVAETTSHDQRLPALNALRVLAEQGFVSASDLERTFEAVTVNEVMADSRGADQRVEDLTRVSLQVRVAYEASLDAPLLAGSKDPDARVREISVRSVAWLAVARNEPQSTHDATLLGALYDRNPRVQAMAVDAVWRGSFADERLREVALARIGEVWEESHRDFRIAVAKELNEDSARARPIGITLLGLARSDRSWQVRRLVQA